MINMSKLTAWRRRALVGASLVALLSNNFNGFGQNATSNAGHVKTATPIKHVIVLIGENRTFDHLFATYVPRKGETVSNLLSKGIINADGTTVRRSAICLSSSTSTVTTAAVSSCWRLNDAEGDCSSALLCMGKGDEQLRVEYDRRSELWRET